LNISKVIILLHPEKASFIVKTLSVFQLEISNVVKLEQFLNIELKAVTFPVFH
jgi:hypothetical protein